MTGLSSTPSIFFDLKCSEARISLPAAEPMMSSFFGGVAEDRERQRPRVRVVLGERGGVAVELVHPRAERAVVDQQRRIGATRTATSTRNTGPQSEKAVPSCADLRALGADVGQREHADDEDERRC